MGRQRVKFGRALPLGLVIVIGVSLFGLMVIGGDNKSSSVSGNSASPEGLIDRNAVAEVVEKVSPSVVSISASAERRGRYSGFFWFREDSFSLPFYRYDRRWEWFKDDPFFERFFRLKPTVPKIIVPRTVWRTSFGAGFIIDREGHILTCASILREAKEIKVTLSDGKEYKATLVGTDRQTDLAVVKIEAENLKPIKLGDSDKLRLGDWVIAFGNPYGLRNSVDVGIVSGLGRKVPNFGTNLIQTNLRLPFGYGGGPLVNLNGEVIGVSIIGPEGVELPRGGGFYWFSDDPEDPGETIFIIPEKLETSPPKVTVPDYISQCKLEELKNKLAELLKRLKETQTKWWIYPSLPHYRITPLPRYSQYAGPSFAVPINVAKKVVQELIEKGKVRRAWLGVQIRNLEPREAKRYGAPKEKGVIVEKVLARSPAEKAGIKEEDIILKADDKDIKSIEELIEAVQSHKAGDELELIIWRDKKEKTIRVVLGEAPS